MKKKQQKSCISNSSLKSINSNKYNKVTINRILSDLSEIYNKNSNGWVKKIKN